MTNEEVLTGSNAVRDEAAAVDDGATVCVPGVARLCVPAIATKDTTLSCDGIARPRQTAVTSLVYKDRSSATL